MAKVINPIYVCDNKGCNFETPNREELVPVKIGGERSSPKGEVCLDCAIKLCNALNLDTNKLLNPSTDDDGSSENDSQDQV